jgi:hypothetical protein
MQSSSTRKFKGILLHNVFYIVSIQQQLVCTNVSYQIQTQIIDEIHVLARKEVTIFRICYIGNKIWTNTTWEDTNCDKVSAW